MEEVDAIVIQQLKEIGCDLNDEDDEPISSLKELDSSQLMSCVARCVQLVTGDEQFMAGGRLSSGRNMNMANKYKAANELASACLELGFKGDLGYQTFLYGTETDLRKLLLFLIERLPKDIEVPVSGAAVSGEDIVGRLVARSQVSLTWLPPMVGHPNDRRCKWSAKSIPAGVARSALMGKLAPERRRYFDQALRLPTDFASLLEWNAVQLNKDDALLMTKSKNVRITSKLDVDAAQIDGSAGSRPVPARRKRAGSQKDVQMGLVTENHVGDSQESGEDQLTVTMSQLEDELNRYQAEMSQLSSESDLLKLEAELKKEQERLIELEASQKSRDQLRDEIRSVKDEIESMAQQWQQVETKLTGRLRLLKTETASKHIRSNEQRAELSQLKKKIGSKMKEIQAKDESVNELAAKMPQQLPPARASYTKRIIEIVSNVKKQNEEICKVLFETRQLQKDLNILSGKLSRTFTVADELIFKEARTNEWNRKCYKLLASMHDHCDQLLAGVSSIGLILREIRQLEESVEAERSRKTTSNLTRILADLNQIRLENEQLTKKMQGQSSQ